jgi:hypothetical protein
MQLIKVAKCLLQRQWAGTIHTFFLLLKLLYGLDHDLYVT